MALTWLIEIDWDGDGVFEADEAGRMLAVKVRRGRRALLARRGFERMKPGKLTLTLDNYDGRYDPWNSSSPLYPNVLAGKECRVRLTSGVTTYAVFRGLLDEPAPVDYRNPRVKLAVLDGWDWLAQRFVRDTVQANIMTGDAIERVLVAAGWPMEQWRLGVVEQSELGESTRLGDSTLFRSWGVDIGDSADTIPDWWAEGYADALIHELVESEYGLAYVATDGQFTFRGRQQLMKDSVAITVTQDQILKDLSLGQPADLVRNVVTVQARPLNTQNGVTLWQMRDKPQLGPGSSLTILAGYTYSGRRVAAKNLITPAAATDYTANSDAGGGGTDLTANLTVTLTAYGKSAELIVTNTGGVAAYITLLKIRGDALEQIDAQASEATDSASKKSFGERSLDVDLAWQQSTIKARDFSIYLKSWLKDGKTAPVIVMENRPTLQFGYDIGTRLKLNLAKPGLNDEFRIGGIEHGLVGRSPQRVQTRWYLEPIDSAQYWQLGVAGRGELGVATVLGY